jgi:hypothetical protein
MDTEIVRLHREGQRAQSLHSFRQATYQRELRFLAKRPVRPPGFLIGDEQAREVAPDIFQRRSSNKVCLFGTKAGSLKC